jgi:hypothetical protein
MQGGIQKRESHGGREMKSNLEMNPPSVANSGPNVGEGCAEKLQDERDRQAEGELKSESKDV